MADRGECEAHVESMVASARLATRSQDSIWKRFACRDASSGKGDQASGVPVSTSPLSNSTRAAAASA
jgi:hypothetical protein